MTAVLPLDHAAAVDAVIGRSRWRIDIEYAPDVHFTHDSHAQRVEEAVAAAVALFRALHPDISPDAVTLRVEPVHR